MSSSQSLNDALGGIKGQPSNDQSPPPYRCALLIGINYSNTLWARKYRLFQPQDDVVRMKEYLIQHAGWSENEIVVLTDAKGTPEDRLPTYLNIMREIELIGKSNCQNVFFLYTGHSDQQRQPERQTPPEAQPKGTPGRIVVEEYDQFIIPTDAVVGPELRNLDLDRIILDDVLHDWLIATLPERSTFLAILDTCHSGTLLDLKHHRCNRTRGLKSLFRRSVRKVLVEPFWRLSGRATEGIARADSFSVSHICNGLCPRRKTAVCPIAVSVSACKDQQQIYENGRSLTMTVVEILTSKPKAGLRDIIDSALSNYEQQLKRMKSMEKFYKKKGDENMRKEIRRKRREARRLMPQVASSGALDLHPYRWSGFATRTHA